MSPASTTSVESRPAVVVLDGVRHGLIDPVGGTRELDAALDTARRAEQSGARAVVVPNSEHWPATAQALAVLLATDRVRVVVEVPADGDPEAVVRFARSATRLAGDRLVVAVQGDRAGVLAEQLRRHWDGAVMVGTDGIAELGEAVDAAPEAAPADAAHADTAHGDTAHGDIADGDIADGDIADAAVADIAPAVAAHAAVA